MDMIFSKEKHSFCIHLTFFAINASQDGLGNLLPTLRLPNMSLLIQYKKILSSFPLLSFLIFFLIA